jgi:hypothetical protein
MRVKAIDKKGKNLKNKGRSRIFPKNDKIYKAKPVARQK